MSDIRVIQNSIMDIDLIVVDYISLLRPDNGRVDRENINQMFRELRHFGLVNHIPIITPIQSNRAGWDAACKHKENLYSIDGIGEYSSIEKECTHIFSILTTPEMRESGVSQIQHLVSRESSLFAPFKINADFETGVLSAVNTVIDKEDAQQILEEIDI